MSEQHVPPFARHVLLVASTKSGSREGRLSPEQRADVLAQHNRGVSHADIGAQYDRTARQIGSIVNCMRRVGGAPVVNQRKAFGYEGPRA